MFENLDLTLFMWSIIGIILIIIYYFSRITTYLFFMVFSKEFRESKDRSKQNYWHIKPW